MTETRVIVDKLNDDPFHKEFSLVTFDELSTFDLVSLLHEVIEYLDAKQGHFDIREDPLEVTKKRFCEFLGILRFSFPADPRAAEEFKNALVTGEKGAVYAVLYFMLSKLGWCKTRAYVARFLNRIEIPPELEYNEQIKEAMEKYETLKKSFSDSHKMVQKLRKESLAPEKLHDEISQLEEEKAQLQDKISELQKRTSGMGSAFQELFDATSKLRQVREERGKLQKTAQQQRRALDDVEHQRESATERLEQVQKTHSDSATALDMLDDIRHELKEKKRFLENDLALKSRVKSKQLEELEKALREPAKSEEDVSELQALNDSTQVQAESLHNEISRLQRLGGEKDGLKMFKQQAAMWSKKLEQEKAQFAEVAQEVSDVDGKITEKESQFDDVNGKHPMRRDQFNNYAVSLREKTANHKAKKSQLASIRGESVVLSRTEAILRSRTGDLASFEEGMEEERSNGIIAKSTDDRPVELEFKGKSLDEISKMIQRLDDVLADKRREVNPLIEARKKLLPKKDDLQKKHKDKKKIYDSIAVGLESERVHLERECDIYQDEALRQESNYHNLHCLTTIAEMRLERLEEEEQYEQGNGQLLRDFKSYKDLYQQKIQQQEQLSKALRKQQKSLKETEGTSSEQRKIFDDLRRLLYLKIQIQQTQQNTNQYEDNGVYDLGQDVGGANIMTIEQHS